MSDDLRVLVASPCPRFIRFVREALDDGADGLVTSVPSLGEAVTMAARRAPDVVVVDASARGSTDAATLGALAGVEVLLMTVGGAPVAAALTVA